MQKNISNSEEEFFLKSMNVEKVFAFLLKKKAARLIIALS